MACSDSSPSYRGSTSKKNPWRAGELSDPICERSFRTVHTHESQLPLLLLLGTAGNRVDYSPAIGCPGCWETCLALSYDASMASSHPTAPASRGTGTNNLPHLAFSFFFSSSHSPILLLALLSPPRFMRIRNLQEILMISTSLHVPMPRSSG